MHREPGPHCEECSNREVMAQLVPHARRALWQAGLPFITFGRYWKIEDVGQCVYDDLKVVVDDILRGLPEAALVREGTCDEIPVEPAQLALEDAFNLGFSTVSLIDTGYTADVSKLEITQHIEKYKALVEGYRKGFPKNSFINICATRCAPRIIAVTLESIVEAFLAFRCKCKPFWYDSWVTGWNLPVNECLPDVSLHRITHKTETMLKHMIDEGVESEKALQATEVKVRAWAAAQQWAAVQ